MSRGKNLKIATLVFLLIGGVNAKGENVPKRIISLKPNITELLFAIGAGDDVIGVTTWCDKPDEAKKLPKVADYINVNVEKVIALKPDIVISSEENSFKEPVKAIENAGIPILLLPFKNVNDLIESTVKLGMAIGRERNAINLVANIKREIETVKVKSLSMLGGGKGGGIPPKALIIVGRRPLVAAGPATYIGELLKIAGGENIIEAKIPYPHIDMEFILTKNPDVIVDLSMGSEAWVRDGIPPHWKGQNIKAVVEGRVYMEEISSFRIGPGLIRQIKRLNDILYKR